MFTSTRTLYAMMVAVVMLFSAPSVFAGGKGGGAVAGSESAADALAAIYQYSMPGATASGYINPGTGFANLFNGQGSKFPHVVNSLLLQQYAFPIAIEDVEKKFNRTDIIYSSVDIDSYAEAKGIQSSKEASMKRTHVFGQQVNGYVIGAFQVQANKKYANLVNYNTLRVNAERFAAVMYKGYNVRLVALPTTVAISYGIDARTGSFSISPVLSALFENGPLGAISTLGGLGLGANKSKGITIPIAMEGQTFFAVLEDPNAPVVNVREGYKEALTWFQQNSFSPRASSQAQQYESMK